MAKVKIKVKSGKGSGQPLVVQKVRLEQMRNPSGTKIYKTKARLTAHIYYGRRPGTTQLRRAN